jgi:hypothetical protein
MAFTVDTRTASEHGVVRTFLQADIQFSTLGNNTVNPNVFATLPTATNLLNTAGGGYVAVESVFVQFAGFTFGKSVSAYSTLWNAFPGNISSFLIGGHDTTTGVNNIQYTKEFGQGVSEHWSGRSRRVRPHLGLQHRRRGVGDFRPRRLQQLLCQCPFPRCRRQYPRRPGLGTVPVVRRAARSERFV